MAAVLLGATVVLDPVGFPAGAAFGKRVAGVESAGAVELAVPVDDSQAVLETQVRDFGRGGEGGGVLVFSYMAIVLRPWTRIPTVPGRRTSGFHRPGRRGGVALSFALSISGLCLRRELWKPRPGALLGGVGGGGGGERGGYFLRSVLLRYWLTPRAGGKEKEVAPVGLKY